MTDNKVKLTDTVLEEVIGGNGSLGPYSDWYDMITLEFSSTMPVEQKEKRLFEIMNEIRQDSRLDKREKEELCQYINGLLGNGR